MKMWKLPNISPMNMRPLDAFSFELARFRHDETTRRHTNTTNFQIQCDIARHNFANDITRHRSDYSSAVDALRSAVKDLAVLELNKAMLPINHSLDRIQLDLKLLEHLWGKK